MIVCFGLVQKVVKKKFKKFSNLRNLKNKKYPFWRFDTFFSDIKQVDINIINDGGWHFTNLKSPENLFLKLKILVIMMNLMKLEFLFKI